MVCVVHVRLYFCLLFDGGRSTSVTVSTALARAGSSLAAAALKMSSPAGESAVKEALD